MGFPEGWEQWGPPRDQDKTWQPILCHHRSQKLGSGGPRASPSWGWDLGPWVRVRIGSGEGYWSQTWLEMAWQGCGDGSETRSEGTWFSGWGSGQRQSTAKHGHGCDATVTQLRWNQGRESEVEAVPLRLLPGPSPHKLCPARQQGRSVLQAWCRGPQVLNKVRHRKEMEIAMLEVSWRLQDQICNHRCLILLVLPSAQALSMGAVGQNKSCFS